MPSDIEIPDNLKERFKKFVKDAEIDKKKEEIKEIREGVLVREKIEEHRQIVMPHPDDPVWYSKPKNTSLQEKLLWASPYDARFPQQRIQRKCFSYYIDYFRCKELMGDDYKPCKFFWNVYTDICPIFWLEKWDELREHDKFPARFDR